MILHCQGKQKLILDLLTVIRKVVLVKITKRLQWHIECELIEKDPVLEQPDPKEFFTGCKTEIVITGKRKEIQKRIKERAEKLKREK